VCHVKVCSEAGTAFFLVSTPVMATILRRAAEMDERFQTRLGMKFATPSGSAQVSKMATTALDGSVGEISRIVEECRRELRKFLETDLPEWNVLAQELNKNQKLYYVKMATLLPTTEQIVWDRLRKVWVLRVGLEASTQHEAVEALMLSLDWKGSKEASLRHVLAMVEQGAREYVTMLLADLDERFPSGLTELCNAFRIFDFHSTMWTELLNDHTRLQKTFGQQELQALKAQFGYKAEIVESQRCTAREPGGPTPRLMHR
jgi:hypothetical protein